MAVLANIVYGDPPPATSAGPLGPVITALMKRDPAARPGAAAARRLLAAACSSAGASPGALAGGNMEDGASARNGAGARNDPVRNDPSGRNGAALPDGARARNGAGAPDGPRAGGDGARPRGAGGSARARASAAAGGNPDETVIPDESLFPDDTVIPGGPRRPGGTLAFPAGPPGGVPAFAGQPPAGQLDQAWQPSQGWQPGQATQPGNGEERRRPGRHRRALLFGGGGTAVVLAALMVAMGLAHAARLQAIKRTAASSTITPAAALPTGYHWYTARASTAPRRAGFSIAVPEGWRAGQRGDTTMIRDPATGAAITVIRPAPGGPGPLSEAQLLASGPHQSYPGYHQIALLPVPFHGTLAGAWRFAYVRPGTGNEQVLVLVARLDTPLGAQPYELAVTSPRQAWLASRAAFGEAMTAFTPQA
jgi:hypothetical protein